MSLSQNTEALQELLKEANNLPEAGSDEAVLYTEQTLTEEQKLQARTNIGAASSEEVVDLEETTLKEVDRQSIVQDVIDSVIFIQGEVHAIYGEVEEDKTVILHGDLADDTYTFKFELKDGTKVDVGTLTLGEEPEPEPVPNFTNLADPTSADWLTDNRLNSSGTGTALTGSHVTNFFPVKNGDVIRVKGIDLSLTSGRVAMYNSEKSVLFSTTISATSYVTDKALASDLSSFVVAYTNDTVAYMRIAGELTGTKEDVIITKNEEITYS